MKKTKIQIKHISLLVEVAESESEWGIGLSNRMELSLDSGMLFVFPTVSRVGFWMKQTYISLDILWLDASKKIIWIEKNAPAEVGGFFVEYDPPVEAGYVLELVAWSCDVNGFFIGDIVIFHENFV